MKRFHHVELTDLPAVECCCGTVRRAFIDKDDAPASVHYLELRDEPTTHYHKKTTEIYLVLEGEGHLEVDGERIPVKPLSAVMISPGCRHRAIGKLKIINIPVPKHDNRDFFADTADVGSGQSTVH